MAEEEKVVNTEDPTTSESTEQDKPEAKEAPEVPEKPAEEKPEGRANERIRELNERVKNAEEQNRIALATIQQMQQNAQKPPADEPETEYLDPAVKALASKNKRLEMALGGVANELDAMKARSNRAFKDYDKLEPEVERVHSEMLRNGQFVSRSLIYTHLKGQEALRGGGRQPAPVVEKEPDKPAAIPNTKATAKQSARPNRPETLAETVERLKDVKF